MKNSSAKRVIGNCFAYSLGKRFLGCFKNSALLMSLLFLFGVNFAIAQNRIITGIVTDSKGETLPGVGIKVKGSSVGATTQSSGSYSIKVPNDKAILVFSYVGFATREVLVSSKSVIDVSLKEDVSALKEVVVIGYGTARKQDLTGSVGVVRMEDVAKSPSPSIAEALAGRVAGVEVSATDGQPGDGFNFSIRGNTSINGSNTPLFVIDGFPLENPDLNALNPTDIETITVLKDAASSAIYGSRGANGVVVITTKRGKKGQPAVSYNGTYGFSSATNRVELMNPYEFVKLQLELPAPSVVGQAGAEQLYLSNGTTLEDYRNVKGIDWQDKILRNGAFNNHTLSISGGTESTKYSVSGNYVNQQGVVIASSFKRAQGRFTLDQQVNKKLKIGLNSNYANNISDGTTPRNQTSAIGGNDINFNLLYSAWSYRPITGDPTKVESLEDNLLDPDNATDQRVNPVTSALNEYNRRINNAFSSNLYGDYQITKELKLRLSGQVSLNRGRNEVFNNSLTRAGSPLTTQGQANGINGSFQNLETNDYVTENTLTYNKKFKNKSSLSVLGLYSLQYNRIRNNGYQATKMPDDTRGLDALNEGLIANPTYKMESWGMQSFGGRVDYNWLNKYVFTASLRADGSSKFAEGHRYGYFPSVGVAWKMGEEKFIKDLKFVSQAKLRANYGVTGNNRIGAFDYMSQISGYPSSSPNSYYVFGNQIYTAVAITQLGNEDLSWETTGVFDAGIEVGFLHDRISLEAGYYNKLTSDLLLDADIAPASGFTRNRQNVGSIRNRGFEFTLNSTNVRTRDFSWSSNFNISFNKNNVVELMDGARFLSPTATSGQGNALSSANNYIVHVNHPIANFYGYVFDGIYQTEDFDLLPNGTYVLKDNIPFFQGNSGPANRYAQRPGDPKYKDINGDGFVNTADQTILGNPYPVHIGGFSNNLSYKNFDLNVFFQWSYGNEVYNANRVNLEGGTPVGYNVNQLATYVDRWTPENPSNLYYRVNANGTRVTSSRVIEDASFLRLKTVQLSYSVPATISKRVGAKSIKAYASAQNIYTWTKYSGPDPEVSTKGYGIQQGYDFSAYPRALTFTFGLNLSL